MRRHLVPLGLSVAGGGLLCFAFPTFDLWWVAPLALGLMAASWTADAPAPVPGAERRRPRPARRGFLLGTLSGLVFFVPTLSWSGIYVGAVPWIALATLEALFLGLAGALYGWLSRSGRVRPLAFALVWVVVEGFRGRAPYGGFPWLKIAFGQADGTFGRLVALGGAPFVGFVVALVGGLLALAAQQLLARRRSSEDPSGDASGGASGGASSVRRGVLVPVVAPVAGAVVLGLAGIAVPLPTDGPSAQFLGVQGNVPHPGLDFNAERRAVLDNHVAATLKAQADVAAGRAPAPDLVVWPENASDIDPLRNLDAKELILQTVAELKRPLIVGGLLEEPPGELSNVSLLFEPGLGNTDRYVKRHPVPFAEYIPDRAFWRTFSKEVDLVRRDFAKGTGPGVFTVQAANGQQIRAGLAICFEVAYDDIMRDVVTAGANVLVVQTNNATFGFTAESPQQLAISRIRAMELGRSVVHVSTVGQSALITPDGTAHQVTSLFTQALVRGALPLRDAPTLATRVGEAPEWLAVAALLVLAATSAGAGLRRRHTREGRKDEDDDDAA